MKAIQETEENRLKFVAGVDGGGTGTTVECRDLQGNILCRREFGPMNLNSVGEERFCAVLEEIVLWLHTLGECKFLCIGTAGVSNPHLGKLAKEVLEHTGSPRFQLKGDHEVALWGALEGKAGCVLIAGTGSICFGRSEGGLIARSGGWGHLIDDGGSGYALGRDALHAVVRSLDGRGPETALSAAVTELIGSDSQEELIAYVYDGDKSRLAALSTLVEQAAAAGDEIACRILRDNAGELVDLVCAVVDRLGLRETEVAMTGGLLEHNTGLRRETVCILHKSRPELRCIAPKQDAAGGAAMMALAEVFSSQASAAC